MELLVGDVNPDHVARLAHQYRCTEDVGPIPSRDRARQGLRGNRVEELAGVSEVLGQPPAHLEVELRALLTGDVAVHGLDLIDRPEERTERCADG